MNASADGGTAVRHAVPADRCRPAFRRWLALTGLCLGTTTGLLIMGEAARAETRSGPPGPASIAREVVGRTGAQLAGVAAPASRVATGTPKATSTQVPPRTNRVVALRPAVPAKPTIVPHAARPQWSQPPATTQTARPRTKRPAASGGGHVRPATARPAGAKVPPKPPIRVAVPGPASSTVQMAGRAVRPSRTVPALAMPSLAMPALTAPSPTVPALTLPALSVPALTLPALSLPALTLPVLTPPGLTLPVVTVPGCTVPGRAAPAVTLPALTVPRLSGPAVPVPPLTGRPDPLGSPGGFGTPAAFDGTVVADAAGSLRRNGRAPVIATGVVSNLPAHRGNTGPAAGPAARPYLAHLRLPVPTAPLPAGPLGRPASSPPSSACAPSAGDNHLAGSVPTRPAALRAAGVPGVQRAVAPPRSATITPDTRPG